MSSSSAAPSLPLPTTTTALTSEAIANALRDLTTAVQGLHLVLAGPYGLLPAAPSAATNGPVLLSWPPPHRAASAAIYGPAPPPPWQPPHWAASAAIYGPSPSPPSAATN